MLNLNHAHQCNSCKFIWSHTDACQFSTTQVFQIAHSCPRCGQKQTQKYWGSEAPMFEQTMPLLTAKRDVPIPHGPDGADCSFMTDLEREYVDARILDLLTMIFPLNPEFSVQCSSDSVYPQNKKGA